MSPLAFRLSFRELAAATTGDAKAVTDAQAITGMRSGDVAPQVFLCGDPARIDPITTGWSNLREVCAVREYRVVTGSRNGLSLSAASTGIGAPSAAILIEELANLGAATLIRIGNSGGLDPSLGVGDLVVTTGAVRDDGTSRGYVVPEYPAVAHYEVVSALAQAAERSGHPWRAGVTWSLDAFYARNARVGEANQLLSMSHRGYWTPAQEEKIRSMQAAGVLNCEMEAGILLTLAGLFGLRAGCVCVVSDRTPWPGPSELDLDRNMATCIEVAHVAMQLLAGETP